MEDYISDNQSNSQFNAQDNDLLQPVYIWYSFIIVLFILLLIIWL